MKIIVHKNIYIYKIKIVIIKSYMSIRIAGKVARYIDASMNRATPRTVEFDASSLNAAETPTPPY